MRPVDGAAPQENARLQAAEGAVPDVRGMDLYEATELLEAAGFVRGAVHRVYTGRLLPGEVLATQPAAGEGAPPGTPIYLDVESERLGPAIIAGVVLLIFFSAFFSGSEVALLSLHRIQVNAMSEEQSLTGPIIAKMLNAPGQLLTTILVGNMIVNVLIGVLLGTRVAGLMEAYLQAEAWSYVASVAVVTGVLVLFGEITPKIVAVTTPERFARVAVLPLYAVSYLISPVRDGLLAFTNFLFRITRFHDLRAAPFITDEEFKSAIANGEAEGVLEEDEREMIQGILEFRDAMLREILVPRPDVEALPHDATVRDALEVLGACEFSRYPVYEESLDKVLGILVAKDMMPAVVQGDFNRRVSELARPPMFAPETMTVQQFVEQARLQRTHMAVVVDEYGGTEGIVTLEDALEQVVGDIMDEGEQETLPYEQTGDRMYRVEGSCSIDVLNETIGTQFEDEEHETLGGYLMSLAEKVLEPGDEIERGGVRFTVEAVDGKRVSAVVMQLLPHWAPGVPDEDGEED